MTIPLHGKSLLKILKGGRREEPDYFISGLKKFRMFRNGDYKIVRLNGGDWELYNIKNDPTELEDISATFPDKVSELSNYYNRVETGFIRINDAK